MTKLVTAILALHLVPSNPLYILFISICNCLCQNTVGKARGEGYSHTVKVYICF